MKAWEMIKELTENPEKKFITPSGSIPGAYVSSRDGKVVWEGQGQYGQELIVNLDDEWEELKEPVSFMELLQEVKMDHNLTFRYESFPEINFSFKGKLYKFLCQIGSEFASVDVARLLTEGRFYIED